MRVDELIKCLLDCRGEAEIFTSYSENSSSLDKVLGAENKGTHVILYEHPSMKTLFKNLFEE